MPANDSINLLAEEYKDPTTGILKTKFCIVSPIFRPKYLVLSNPTIYTTIIKANTPKPYIRLPPKNNEIYGAKTPSMISTKNFANI